MADGVQRAGTTLPDGGEALAWRLEGMDCASCVAKVEGALARMPGVSAVEANLMGERLTLRLDRSAGPEATPETVERRLAAIGHPATRLAPPGAPATHRAREAASEAHARGEAFLHAHGDEDDDEAAEGRRWWQTAKGRLVLGLGALVAAAWGLSHLLPREAYWIYLAATLVALWPFGRRAVALARAGNPFSIETLMCVAALGAVAIGAAEEAAVVVFLFALGELLENVAAGRARAGIRALVELIPRTARRERADGAVEAVPAERLGVGDLVRVRPGDRVPCDGEIIEGRSSLDESPVTGESVPVPRGPGEPVLAGSVNADGNLRVRVTRAAADNTLARIARMVEEATASRAPTQRLVERFARWWTPGAMGAALLTILVPPLLFGGDWWTWTYRGLALLLVACPCALVISVPAAVASGLSAGARRGLLVKGGAALEAIGAARTVAFDKTGTLTAGRPRVTDVVPLAAGADDAAVLRSAAAVEAGSSHPLARSVVEAAAAHGIAPPPATEAGTVPGKAVFATVEGRRVEVGSPRHAAEAGAALPAAAAARIEALEAEGKTVVAVLSGGAPLGLLAFRDEPREDAAAGMAALRGLGVTPVMLTGDNERTGRAVAGALGMEVRAQLLPEDKLRVIEAMKADGPVVMVGDGINDAPALAAASVGVAMGGGTDVALEAADAALVRERVMGVAELVALSRATVANIRQNVGIALGLKALFLVTTLAGVTGLWIAILADTGATVLVTANALRMLRWRPAAVPGPSTEAPA
ncbi:heavy metal translocating P-type ATPase [Dankookia sp. P2]|uniref:heavy metal translocating P-type ATPase n=1 Tax=Dankookia sp. P2 TaxID=3423955 RepID=UPI003D66CB46